MADNENLNEEVVVVVEDASVVTVPIDDTLTNSGEAADAKAVGDALALKADKSELQTAVNVNGQTADAQGTILVRAEHIKMTDSLNSPTVKDAVETLEGQDAGDIPMDKTNPTGPSVKTAIETAQAATAETIPMNSEQDAPSIAEEMADFTDTEINSMLVAAGYKEAST